MRAQRKHIVLLGFMGCGKTTVGRLVADMLHLPFIDLDATIVSRTGRSITEIFESNGEETFRKIETETLSEVLSFDQRRVVSLGGGTPCYHDNMGLIRSSSISFYLRLGMGRLAKRLSQDISRPLVANKEPKTLLKYIRETMNNRRQYYKSADHILRANDAPEQIAERIVRHIKSTIQL